MTTNSEATIQQKILLRAARSLWGPLGSAAVRRGTVAMNAFRDIDGRFAELLGKNPTDNLDVLTRELRNALERLRGEDADVSWSRGVQALDLALLQAGRDNLTVTEAGEAAWFLDGERSIYLGRSTGEFDIYSAIQIRFTVPENVDVAASALAIADFYRAVSALHVSMGGSGLTVDDWFHLQSVDAAALVGA